MRLFSPARVLTALSLFAPTLFPSPTTAIDLDPTQPDQVKDAAKKVATQLFAMYANPTNNQVISGISGLLTYPPYYWWEAGAMFGQLLDYWYYTNDSTWNELIKEGIVHQIGDEKNFMPANQSKDEGNDDQLFWAFTVMSAAEYNFDAPPDGSPGWLALAQSVFNQLVGRWDTQTCGGGVRWQIYQWLGGWDYKNLASNGGMFQLAARLALYTGNTSYADYAEKTFKWLTDMPLISEDWQVYDGMDVKLNCTRADQNQWTYNYGIMIGGAAYMYNYTNGSQVWADRLNGFIKHTSTFFPSQKGGVMSELCETPDNCNVDRVSFKAYLARWFAVAAQLAPFTEPQIAPLLQTSAKAAARTCTGTTSNTFGAQFTATEPYLCGMRWYNDSYDGEGGVGQQMSALSVIAANLYKVAKPPFSSRTGGASKGDPGLGTGGNSELPTYDNTQVTTGGKAGAGILTVMAVGMSLGGAWFMIS